MNDKRIFTLEEANSLIPSLELQFGQVMQLRSQLRATYERLEALGAAPTDRPVDVERGSGMVRRLKGRFLALMEAMTETLHAIEEIGVAVKDVDIGLCDFLGEHDGQAVWLCWQYGEKRIGYWHDLNAGFGGRQPIGGPKEAPRRLLH
jgi:hypothetical protein